jgi:hypothetical protein
MRVGSRAFQEVSLQGARRLQVVDLLHITIRLL